MRDFKRNVKGLILESNSSIDLILDIDNGALFNYQNKINTFLNNTVKEIVSIVRDTNANLLTKISENKIINGDMVFNTTENTYQQVIAGQLVSFGSGGGVDPALEGRVDDLENSVSDLESDVQNIVVNQEEMDDNLAIARAELYDLINLTGVSENSSNLGPFSGAYLNDSSTIKEALQALESAVEAGLGATAGDLSSIINQISDLEDALDAESTDRINGDAATLASANAYTDAEIAAIPGVDLSGIETDITTLQNNVNTLQSTDTSLQSQINTINNTTIPNAISSANSYTDSQISALPTGGSSFDTLSHLFYLETFEGTVKGTLSGGAVIIDIATNPLQVLSESKSLYFFHSTTIENFTSSPIEIPNICKKYYWNGSSVQQSVQFTVSLDIITSVSFSNQFPETPSAVIRVYDITNNEYIVLDFSPSVTFPLNTYLGLRGPNNSFSFGVTAGPTTEQVRIEITSNTTNPGDTVIDNVRCSVRTLQGV